MKKGWKEKVGYGNPLRTAYEAYLKVRKEHVAEEKSLMEECSRICLRQIVGAKTVREAIRAFDIVCLSAWMHETMWEELHKWAARCRTEDEAQGLAQATCELWGELNNPALIRLNELRCLRADEQQNFDELYEMFSDFRRREHKWRSYVCGEGGTPIDLYVWEKLLAMQTSKADLESLRCKFSERYGEYSSGGNMHNAYMYRYEERMKELTEEA